MDAILHKNCIDDTKSAKPNTKNELNIPIRKQDLINSLGIIKNGINKANNAKMFDLTSARAMRDILRNLTDIINNVIKACYHKDERLSHPMCSIDIPEKNMLETIVKNITFALDAAQHNGVFETIDESGDILDALEIIGSLIQSMIKCIDLQKESQLLQQDIIKNNIADVHN